MPKKTDTNQGIRKRGRNRPLFCQGLAAALGPRCVNAEGRRRLAVFFAIFSLNSKSRCDSIAMIHSQCAVYPNALPTKSGA